MTTRMTEAPSLFDHLELLSTAELLAGMNQLDQTVPTAVNQLLPQLTQFVDALYLRLQQGGRLFYVGAGTSGRLGVLDAAECPPTFGVSQSCVQGVMAGGRDALVQAVELAEDDTEKAVRDISALQLTSLDTLIGITASGSTPYVIAAVEYAKAQQVLTAAITCNPQSPIEACVTHPLVCIVGPEFVTGSTRLKAGTATKLILNMISTAVMIKLGHVKGNQMIDMQLNNHKLNQRAIAMLMQLLPIDAQTAEQLLQTHGSVRLACEWYQQHQ